MGRFKWACHLGAQDLGQGLPKCFSRWCRAFWESATRPIMGRTSRPDNDFFAPQFAQTQPQTRARTQAMKRQNFIRTLLATFVGLEC